MKRIYAIILAFAMVLALAACGNSTSGSNANSDEKLYIPVLLDNTNSKIANAVMSGAQAAAEDLDVEVSFNTLPEDAEKGAEVDDVAYMTEVLKKNPAAMAVATTTADKVGDALGQLTAKDVPMIGFATGTPSNANGTYKACVYTDKNEATIMATEKLANRSTMLATIKGATPEEPIIIACISDSGDSERITTFVNTMANLCETVQPGKVSIEGNEELGNYVENAAVRIHIEITKSVKMADVLDSVNKILFMEGLYGLFCVDATVTPTLMSATNKGADLAPGARYGEITVVGLEAGSTHKNGVRQGYMYGCAVDDLYQMGYQAVEMAVMAANGEEVVDTNAGCVWMDASNLIDEEIAILLYD